MRSGSIQRIVFDVTVFCQRNRVKFDTMLPFEMMCLEPAGKLEKAREYVDTARDWFVLPIPGDKSDKRANR